MVHEDCSGAEALAMLATRAAPDGDLKSLVEDAGFVDGCKCG